MKRKYLISILLTFVCNIGFAQINFKSFVDSVNWDLSEQEFLSKYASELQPRRHYYSDYDKSYTDYEVAGILLGNYECSASVFIDSISKKIHSLSFYFGNLTKQVEAVDLSEKMDSILYPLFGEPDKIKNDLDNKYVKDLDRTWYKENYIVEVQHMIFDDSHIYSLTVKGVPNKGNDFRVAKWGDSKKSVMQKEGKANQVSIDDMYLFEDYVAGMSCEVVYVFAEDKLTMAKYIFTPSHTNKNDYITDYRELVNLMTEKYGKPNYDAPEWHNSLYKGDYDEYGFAISLGHLSYNAGWLGEITDITVALYGQNYKVSLIIQYMSEKYKDLQKKAEIKRKTIGL